MNSFLRNKQQRLILNGQSSKQSPIKAGVPQESSLGPLFFLVHINDLPNKLLSSPKLFAVDTSIQGFIQALLIMSVLWRKKIKFCNGGSDHEANVIAARGLWGRCEPPNGQLFTLWGDRDGRETSSASAKKWSIFSIKVSLTHQSLLFNQMFFPFYKSLIPPYCYLKQDIKLKKLSLQFGKTK